MQTANDIQHQSHPVVARSASYAPDTSRNVDGLFDDLTRVERTQPAAHLARLRRRGKQAIKNGRLFADRAFLLQDRTLPEVRDLYRFAVTRAARDIMSGRAARNMPPAVEGESEENPRTRMLSAIRRFQYPQSFLELTQAMNQRGGDAARMAAVVRQDEVLSAALLRIVNSPFYGMRMEVDSLERAVALVGFNELSALSLSLSVLQGSGTFQPWRSGLACGIFARRLARMAGYTGDGYFVAGLLHDVGNVLTQNTLPVRHARSQAAAFSGTDLHEAELQELTFSTLGAGVRLLHQWGMPKDLVRMVSRRRDPGRTGRQPDVGVLHLAEVLTTASMLARPDARPLPMLHLAALRAFGIPLADLFQLMDQAMVESDSLAGALIS